MADAETPHTTVSTHGAVTVRQRPSLLLLRLQLKSAEATLELGLAKSRKQGEETSQLLKRLGAARVDLGDPIFADQVPKDPMQAARAAAARNLGRRPGATAPAEHKRAVVKILTAQWDIAALSAEETLALVDRLRFETAEDAGPVEAKEELPEWASPEERMREIMSQLHAPPEDDASPQILFVARLGTEALEKAFGEALAAARRKAEQLARAASMQLGRLSYLNFGLQAMSNNRADRLMRQQRCSALLAGCAYDLAEDEIVSDDPLPVEFTVTVNTNYQLA